MWAGFQHLGQKGQWQEFGLFASQPHGQPWLRLLMAGQGLYLWARPARPIQPGLPGKQLGSEWQEGPGHQNWRFFWPAGP